MRGGLDLGHPEIEAASVVADRIHNGLKLFHRTGLWSHQIAA
ncbi:hypothetical protein [Bradyrhizobium sp.]